MLNVCYSVRNVLFISSTYSQSHCIMISPKINYTQANVKLNCKDLDWTDKLNYLGMIVMSTRLFSVCLDTVRPKYFAAVNALYAHCKHVSDLVKVHLFESHCLPILPYGLDCVYLSSQQIHEYSMYAGIMLTKNVHYTPSESIKPVIYLMQAFDASVNLIED